MLKQMRNAQSLLRFAVSMGGRADVAAQDGRQVRGLPGFQGIEIALYAWISTVITTLIGHGKERGKSSVWGKAGRKRAIL